MPCTAAEPPEKLLKTLVSGPNLASGVQLPPDGPGHGTAVPHPTEGAVPVPPSPCWEQAQHRGADGELPGPEPIPPVGGGIFWERCHRAPAAAVDGEGIKDLEELAELPRDFKSILVSSFPSEITKCGCCHAGSTGTSNSWLGGPWLLPPCCSSPCPQPVPRCAHAPRGLTAVGS